jgi:hypothetical protein
VATSINLTEYGHLDSVDSATDGTALFAAENGEGSFQFSRAVPVGFTFAN